MIMLKNIGQIYFLDLWEVIYSDEGRVHPARRRLPRAFKYKFEVVHLSNVEIICRLIGPLKYDWPSLTNDYCIKKSSKNKIVSFNFILTE